MTEKIGEGDLMCLSNTVIYTWKWFIQIFATVLMTTLHALQICAACVQCDKEWHASEEAHLAACDYNFKICQLVSDCVWSRTYNPLLDMISGVLFGSFVFTLWRRSFVTFQLYSG